MRSRITSVVYQKVPLNELSSYKRNLIISIDKDIIMEYEYGEQRRSRRDGRGEKG